MYFEPINWTQMRLPTIDSKLNTPGVVVRRTGKPRLHWVKENCKWVYKNVLEEDWDEENDEDCIQEITEGALDRQF